MSDVIPIEVGSAVRVLDEDYAEHYALVTCVHGQFVDGRVPCINVVYTSGDEAKRDPYGRQLERMSSLQHESQVQGMPRPGRYWANV